MLGDVVASVLRLLPLAQRLHQEIEDAGRVGAGRNSTGHGQTNVEAGFVNLWTVDRHLLPQRRRSDPQQSVRHNLCRPKLSVRSQNNCEDR